MIALILKKPMIKHLMDKFQNKAINILKKKLLNKKASKVARQETDLKKFSLKKLLSKLNKNLPLKI